MGLYLSCKCLIFQNFVIIPFTRVKNFWRTVAVIFWIILNLEFIIYLSWQNGWIQSFCRDRKFVGIVFVTIQWVLEIQWIFQFDLSWIVPTLQKFKEIFIWSCNLELQFWGFNSCRNCTGIPFNICVWRRFCILNFLFRGIYYLTTQIT